MLPVAGPRRARRQLLAACTLAAAPRIAASLTGYEVPAEQVSRPTARPGAWLFGSFHPSGASRSPSAAAWLGGFAASRPFAYRMQRRPLSSRTLAADLRPRRTWDEVAAVASEISDRQISIQLCNETKLPRPHDAQTRPMCRYRRLGYEGLTNRVRIVSSAL